MGKYATVLALVAAMACGMTAVAEEGKDAKGGPHKRGEGFNPESIFAKMDVNSDGNVTKDEFVAAQQGHARKNGREPKKEEIEARFAKIDTNSDGMVTKEEWKAHIEKMKEHHAARGGEHKEKKAEGSK